MCIKMGLIHKRELAISFGIILFDSTPACARCAAAAAGPQPPVRLMGIWHLEQNGFQWLKRALRESSERAKTQQGPFKYDIRF